MSSESITLFRYPGSKPFESRERHLFFGRKQDIEHFYRLVKVNDIVVLISKSGIGKSSLLNAGIIPQVIEDNQYYPIKIRFESSVNKKDSPVNIVRKKISPEGPRSTFLDLLIKNEASIWHEAKEFQIEHQKGILLIFDQFEELFTYPQEQFEAFKVQLTEALFTVIPDRYALILESMLESNESSLPLSDQDIDLLQTPVNIKIIISIRSDKKYLLSKFSDMIPDIEKTTYELQALDRTQSILAIEEPSQVIDDNLASPPFSYSPEARHSLLDFLTKKSQQRVEPFQLQIICNVIERKVNKPGQTITEEDLGNIENIIENYYEDQLNLIHDPFSQDAARKLIEQGLILEEEERRLNLYEGQIFRDYHIGQEVLVQLVNSHLLRREPSLSGGFVYELSHDSLIKPVLVAKTKHLSAKLKAEEEKLAKEQAEELEKQREIVEKERRLRKDAQINLTKARIWSYIATGALLITLAMSFLSTSNYIQLLISNGDALHQGEQFDKAIETYQNAEKFDLFRRFGLKNKIHIAQKSKKSKIKYDKLIQTADSLYKMTEYPLALKKYEEAIKIKNVNNKSALDRLNDLQNNINFYKEYIEKAKVYEEAYEATGNHKEIERAIRIYQNALMLNPNDSININTKIKTLKQKLMS